MSDPESQGPAQPASSRRAESGDVDDNTHRDSDDEPMVYVTPRDYATSARQNRDRMIAEGTDPSMVILQSEVPDHVPKKEGESPEDFAKRYCDTTNDMIRRGVSILNDQCIADVVPDQFSTADGRVFDVGPKSGATKGEYREFGEWFSKMCEDGQNEKTPDQWLKFQKTGES